MSRPADWHLVGLGSDPTPGESWGVRAVATVYANTAQAASQTRQLIRSVESSTGTGVWHGDAGDAFRELIADFPADIQACETSYQSARDAMNWWAGRLEDHQASADRGLEQARAASSDLQAAQAALNTALANAKTTSSALADIERDQIRYKTTEPPAGVSAPTPSQVARARRASADAANAQRTAGNQVDDAQARLDAAARMVADAAAAYETDAQQTITKLDTAHDQALPENDIWEKIRRSGAWQVLVVIATVVVVVAAVAAFILTGPIAVIVGVIAVVAGVILAINDVLEWHAGLKSGWEAAFSVILTVIPGGVLMKAGKASTSLLVRMGMKLSPKATVALTGVLRTAGLTAKNSVTQIRRFAAPVSDAANRAVPMAGDVLSAVQRAKLNMCDRLIERFAGNPRLQRLFDGSRFNWERAGHFEFNEIAITRPGRRAVRVDSYTPDAVVVSRKATQLAGVSEATAKGYIDEAVTKYGPRTEGITIADTKGNHAKLGDRANELIGKELRGDLILEVPIQDSPIPQDILDYAAARGVEIQQVPRVR